MTILEQQAEIRLRTSIICNEVTKPQSGSKPPPCKHPFLSVSRVTWACLGSEHWLCTPYSYGVLGCRLLPVKSRFLVVRRDSDTYR